MITAGFAKRILLHHAIEYLGVSSHQAPVIMKSAASVITFGLPVFHDNGNAAWSWPPLFIKVQRRVMGQKYTVAVGGSVIVFQVFIFDKQIGSFVPFNGRAYSTGDAYAKQCIGHDKQCVFAGLKVWRYLTGLFGDINVLGGGACQG